MAGEQSGADILERSEAAYDALSSYSGTSAVISVSNRSSSARASTASAKIQFARGSGLRIEGHAAGGRGKFALFSDLKQMWTSYDRRDGGAWKESPELGLGGVTGISASAATTIPALLIRSRWGYPFNLRHEAQAQGREVISRIECFKVVCGRDTGTKTFWVDSASFLLRQMREEADEAQTSATNSRVRELLRERRDEQGKEMEARFDEDKVDSIKSTMSLHVFAISAINEPLDASLFQKPD